MIKLHKEGYRTIVLLLTLLVAFNLVLNFYGNLNDYLANGIILFSTFLFLFIASFFRKPRRNMLNDNECVISPCDGKVVAIEEVQEDEYFNEKRLLVSIFMSPANVHINWNPIGGVVQYTKYHPGRYLMAYNPKSSTDNERNTVVIGDDSVEVLVRQIAGFLARRIVHYVSPGDEVEQGSEFGFIKFGSRIDLFLPLDADVKIDLKQKVKGGKTIIAKLA